MHAAKPLRGKKLILCYNNCTDSIQALPSTLEKLQMELLDVKKNANDQIRHVS